MVSDNRDPLGLPRYYWSVSWNSDTLDSLDQPDLQDDPLLFWQRKQRELVSSMVDYNLGTLVSLIAGGTIDLSPHYQRRFRWDLTRQSKLIESFLMNVPIPPVFLNEDEYGQYSVIDGKQRLHAISDYFRGAYELQGLEVFSELIGFRMEDLPRQMQMALKARASLRAIIILRQSDPDVQLEVFQRLNSGGVKLNPQEVRNSAYPGPLNDLVLELSTTPLFHRLLGIPKNKRSAIYDDMRDAELVLRYFAFKDTWETFHGSMKHLLDRYMRDNRNMPEQDLAALRTHFMRTITTVNEIFGEAAFRRFLPEKNVWRKQILASLYDAEMFGSQGIHGPFSAGYRDSFIARFKLLFEDPAFKRSMEAATNNPGNFRSRIAAVRNLYETTAT